MTILVLSSVFMLFICDFLLVKYCNVRKCFPLYAFRFFVILLAVVTLMLTGDITIAYGG